LKPFVSYVLFFGYLVTRWGKEQKKLGEIQKKKFQPVISGAFFLQIIFI
jgi:hypothetical protein